MVLAARGRVLRRLADVITVNEARELTRSVLAEALPRRWEHVQGVAGMAERVSASLALSGERPGRRLPGLCRPGRLRVHRPGLVSAPVLVVRPGPVPGCRSPAGYGVRN
jgi:hypothetical protein